MRVETFNRGGHPQARKRTAAGKAQQKARPVLVHDEAEPTLGMLDEGVDQLGNLAGHHLEAATADLLLDPYYGRRRPPLKRRNA